MPLVTYEFADGIATVRMDDGKANVMTLAMFAELNAALDRAVEDNAVVILTGRDRMFSAGYDLAMFNEPPEVIVSTLREGGRLVHRLLDFPQPVVTASAGHTIAQGLFVALTGDVRIGVDADFKVGMNEVPIGLTIPHYAVELARHRLSPTGFDWAALTGRFFTPREAMPRGIFTSVVSPDVLIESARTAAESLTKLNMDAYRATKARVRGGVLERIARLHAEEFGS